MSSSLTFRLAESDADRRAIQHVRYRAYCEEAQIQFAHADHERRLLVDLEDERGALLMVCRQGDVVGSVRLMFGRDGAITNEHRDVLRIDEFEGVVGIDRLVVVERLCLLSKVRGDHRASIGLILELVKLACTRGADVLLADSEPHLLPLYRRLGMQPIAPPVDFGFVVLVPLVILLRDRAHLEKLGSPVAEVAAEHLSAPIEPELLALLPGAQPNSSCDIHQRVRLLEGLTSVQAEIVSEGAELLEFEAGARVVIEQRSNTTLFVVVDGCVEAVFEGAIIATVGPGEVFGEFAFLLGRPRTATVRAASRARVLAFSAGQLQRLAETHPEIAVHVFRNLARSVALKLDSHDDL